MQFLTVPCNVFNNHHFKLLWEKYAPVLKHSSITVKATVYRDFIIFPCVIKKRDMYACITLGILMV